MNTKQESIRTETDTMGQVAVPAWAYWGAIVLNFVVLQACWFRAVRRSAAALLAIGAAVTVGMWLERFMLVTTALYRDFLPAAVVGLLAWLPQLSGESTTRPVREVKIGAFGRS